MTSKGHGPKHSKLDAAAFASNQLSLLEKERLAEVAEVSDALTTFSPSQLQARGLALLNLVIESVRTGLGGRTYIYRNSSTC
jgi:DNA polymerase alpha-associated DNA helicase A